MAEDPVAERVNRMEQAIRELRFGTLAGSLKKLDESVEKTVRLQERLKDDLNGLRGRLLEYIDEDRGRQTAQAALLDVRAELDREFGHYQAVRRSATGVLRALDTGIVAAAALLEVAMRLMIDAPGYWLPPAVAAVVAWIGDRREIAPRAALEAIGCDAGKTALFISLMAARYARHDAAGRWFHAYLNSLDCRSLGSDFEAVMDAAARGDLGVPAHDHLTAVCASWHEQLREDRELAGRQVERWQTFINSKRRHLGDNFGLLPEMTAGPGWTGKLDQLEANSVFRPMKDWLQGQLAPAGLRNPDPAASPDALLQSLVAAHDNREAELLWLGEQLRAAAANPGSRDRKTKKSPDHEPAGQAERDFLTLVTDAALSTPAGTPSPVPPFALPFSGAFIKKAVQTLSQRNERSRPPSLEVYVDGWQCAMLPNDDEERHVREYEEFIRSKMRKEHWVHLPILREANRIKWEEREKAGKSKIYLVAGEVDSFFAEWQRGTEDAETCIRLIDSYLSPGKKPSGSAAEGALAAPAGSHPPGPASEPATAGEQANWALSPPDWDLLPPSRHPGRASQATLPPRAFTPDDGGAQAHPENDTGRRARADQDGLRQPGRLGQPGPGDAQRRRTVLATRATVRCRPTSSLACALSAAGMIPTCRSSPMLS